MNHPSYSMPSFKGMLALDIDGTLTVSHHEISKNVKEYLESLAKDGWKLFFVTGRTFSFTFPLIAPLDCPYLLSVQNGAALFEMPKRKLLQKHYLSVDFVSTFASLKGSGTGMLLESGIENGDICYYVPNDFSKEELEYIQYRISITPEKWVPLSSFLELPISEFAVGKYFASKEKVNVIAQTLEKVAEGKFYVTVIRDPFRKGFYLGHLNHPNASKGNIVQQCAQRYRPLIVAGDDYNDIEMLKRGDLKIVMGNAPQELYPLGDIIAPPASEEGIIPALSEAINRIRS